MKTLIIITLAVMYLYYGYIWWVKAMTATSHMKRILQMFPKWFKVVVALLFCIIVPLPLLILDLHTMAMKARVNIMSHEEIEDEFERLNNETERTKRTLDGISKELESLSKHINEKLQKD